MKQANNSLHVKDRYWKEVIQVSTEMNDIKVQYLHDIVRKRIKYVTKDPVS